jgi:hypothetical protein
MCRTDVDELVDDILKEEPLIPHSKKHYLVTLINSKLDSKYALG